MGLGQPLTPYFCIIDSSSKSEIANVRIQPTMSLFYGQCLLFLIFAQTYRKPIPLELEGVFWAYEKPCENVTPVSFFGQTVYYGIHIDVIVQNCKMHYNELQ